MPTQRRIFPPRNINRFSYVRYMRPSRFTDTGRGPARQFFHRQFNLLLNLAEQVLIEAYKRKASTNIENSDWNIDGEEDPAEVLPSLGIEIADFLKHRTFYALQYLVESDKEWDQHADAWQVFKKLKVQEQEKINKESQKKWHYKSRWKWDDLLTTIARDQNFFCEVLIEGPTKAGLVGSRHAHAEALFEKHALSRGTAVRIYNAYSEQLSHLLGVGAVAPLNLRTELKRLGFVDSNGRFPGRPIDKILVGKSSVDRKRFSDIGIHFFAHALQNLQRWRYGRQPLPWKPYECMESCLRLRQRLAVRPPLSS